MRWYAQDEVNQEDSEQNEVDGMKKGADSTGNTYVKERSVTCNEEDTDGRARVTTHDEQVLPVDWTTNHCREFWQAEWDC